MLKPQGGVFPGAAGATLRKCCSPAVPALPGAVVQLSSLHTWPDLSHGSNLLKSTFRGFRGGQKHVTLRYRVAQGWTQNRARLCVCLSVCLCVPACGEADTLDRLRTGYQRAHPENVSHNKYFGGN